MGVDVSRHTVKAFFKTLEAQLVWRRPWENHRRAEIVIVHCINGFYSTRRRRLALCGQSPVAFEWNVA